MKRLFGFSVLFSAALLLSGQAPEKMSYQAVIRNGSNNLVIESPIGMKISILQGNSEGDAVYVEIYNPNPESNENGLVTLEIGSGIPLSGVFSEIDWSNGPFFIKTEIDPTGGTDYTLTGISQLLTVPFAFYSKIAETADYNLLNNLPELFDGDYLSLENVPDMSIYATKDMAGERITNLGNPEDPQDAVTVGYIEEYTNEVVSSLGLFPENYSGNMTDIDGNIYKTVQIGGQIWMAENLRVTRLNDGTEISLISNDSQWYNATEPGYCWYQNDKFRYGVLYGAIYNWYVVNTGNLCPTGWHVPTNEEWEVLANFLGGISIAGGKLKATGSIFWNRPNLEATNETGFSAIPSGERIVVYNYLNGEYQAKYWTATDFYGSSAIGRYLSYNSGQLFSDTNIEYFRGLSVRCVKD